MANSTDPTPAARSTPAVVALLTTGGTVASTAGSDGMVPVLGPDDLVGEAAVGSDAADRRDVDLRARELMAVDSSAMTTAEQFAIVRAVDETLADPTVDGIVITHGTDTMEETAFLVDMFAHDPRPVVFTGAQRPADDPEADGPRNIADAVRLAADPAARGRGTLISFAGQVWPVRGVFKVSTTAAVAFDTVADDLSRPVVDIGPEGLKHTRVDSYTLYPGISPGLIAASVAQNAAAIVLAATGSGNTHPDITAEVAQAVRQGVVVVVTTRVPHGSVAPMYGGGGGGVDLERAGAVTSPWLRAPQARMALLALLSTGHDAARIADFFRRSTPA